MTLLSLCKQYIIDEPVMFLQITCFKFRRTSLNNEEIVTIFKYLA